MSKSQNKHYRFYFTAVPLGEELSIAIESGRVDPLSDLEAGAGVLVDQFGWDITDVKGIWSFGPELAGPNILVNTTKGVQYLSEIKDSCIAAVQ